MRKLVRWILISAVPLLLVPCCLAQVLLVDAEGTSYTVQVVPAAGGHSPDATALSFDRVPLSGAPTSGVIDPTQDAAADRDPILVLAPGSAGPVLIWSRRSGHFDQIAYSRYDGHGWTEAAYFASAPRHQLRPRAGVDASGTGYVVLVETGGSGSVMMATFDPLTGNLISSPQ